MPRHRTRGFGYGAVVMVWVMLVSVMQQCGAQRMTLSESIARSFDASSLRVSLRNESVNYTAVPTNATYNSSAHFDPKAMEELYLVTNTFIHAIQPDEIVPEGFVQVENRTLRLMGDPILEWDTLVKHYAGVISVVSVGLLFIVLMPIIGLCFCCCRCSGCCGARAQPFEKRRDPCKRITLGIVLAIVAVIILFGVVCAFVTNEYMEDGIVTLPSKLTVAVNDANHYLANTNNEIDHLLIKNYEELKDGVNDTLHDGGTTLQKMLAEMTNADVIYSLKHMMKEFESIKSKLETLQSKSEELQANATSLQTALQDIKKNLTDSCSTYECKKVFNDTFNGKTETELFEDRILFKFLPKVDFQTYVDEVGNITDLKEDVEDGITQLENIGKNISDATESKIPFILSTLNETGDAIKSKSGDLTNMVNKITKLLDSETQPVIKEIDKIISDYGQYRYYAGIAMSSILLLILLCITLGLFYGFCGKRPDSSYGDDCCNKGTGARFLMLGVYVMFIFSAILMILILAFFLLGIATDKVVCQSLRNPNDTHLLDVVDKVSPFNIGSKSNLNLSVVLQSCHMNDSIYQVLRVSDIMDITEVNNYMKHYKIDEMIENFTSSITFDNNTITLLSDDSKKILLELRNSSLDNLTDILEVNITINLRSLAEELDQVKDEIPPGILLAQKERLEDLQDNLVDPMNKQINEMKVIAAAIEKQLKFNKTSLSEAVDDVINEVTDAQNVLSQNGTDMMQNISRIFADTLKTIVNNYLERVVNFTMNDLGRCGPVSQVLNATLIATCDEILNPFNGFWASIGWCLVLFIPAIILSVKLASLYRKSDPYHAPLPDSEYLYDAYADRDNIPLANGPDKKNHHRRYNETYDNSSGYLGDYNAHMGRGERDRRDRAPGHFPPEDARYTDMAPKYTPLGYSRLHKAKHDIYLFKLHGLFSSINSST